MIGVANSAGLMCIRDLSTLGGCCTGLADPSFRFCAVFASRVVSSNTGADGLIFVVNTKIIVHSLQPLQFAL